MQSERTLREIKRFIFSYHFSTGLRMTIGVVLPSVVFYYLGYLSIGIGLSTGALCTGISDVPGTALHRRNGLLISTTLNGLIALGTGLVIPYFSLSIPWILLVCFFCGMLLVYGNRGGNIGIGGLLVMVMVIGEPTVNVADGLLFASLILGGCLWYDFLALLLWQIRPYLSVQQALGSALVETAYYLELRSNFYQPGVNVTENYNAVLAQQIKVNEQTESVRELLLKRRADQQGTTSINKSLVMIFLEAVDLQEQVMTSHINYEELQKIFPDDSVLGPFRHLVYLFSEELKNIGIAVSAGLRSRPHYNLPYEIEKVKKLLADFRNTRTSLQERTDLVALNNILQTLQEMAVRYHYLHRLSRLDAEQQTPIDPNLELSRFVTRQRYDVEVFTSNLTFRSNNFRHAIRLSLATIAGFLLGEFIGLHRVYWILLTIVVILKPGFSLTKTKSTQRLWGTVIGALFALGLLHFVHVPAVIFVAMLLCILGAYSFTTFNYTVSVFFTTPYVIFLLHFLHPEDIENVLQRVLDTFIGGTISFLASHLLWPSWEYKYLPAYMSHMLRSNQSYFDQSMKLYTKAPFNITEFKLARKDTHVSTANLMAAFQRMLSEPKSRHKNGSQVYHFVVLNHSLSSHIATLANMGMQHPMQFYRPEYNVIQAYLSAFMQHIEDRMNAIAATENDQKAPPVADFEISNHAFDPLDQHLNHLLQLRQQEIDNKAPHSQVRSELLEVKNMHDQLHLIHSLLKDILKTIQEREL
ncbi:TIGR01666 family membrane protein [Chitinophaga costaii]|uniref:TIGR01666 family membrane protein n=1 Tax=Chitinophaga costaii TaxID=1335309 RepID=A0A1C4G6F6_9BACT|nr:FUSC family membrane protein [Chitinophaga costaii]PUZ19599.1 hypothetical protein DCM91_20410 [Chitinophaga costaii]SCC63770.1 TIGR01666 family membrane protein [Chitinophaga costaii]